MLGGEGDDTIMVGNGRDGYVDGGAGDDVIDGGRGSDTQIYGGPGDDIIRVGNGRDRAFGGEGNDLIDGGRGSDRLWGGAGHDVIIGGRGWDFTNGEDGYDACFGPGCEANAASGCEVHGDCADGYWCILPGGLCVPPDGSDANGVNICNGLDDDFDGAVDEDYFAEETMCEVGGCMAVGSMQCVDGVEVDTCPTDPVCIAETACDDGEDNDGDGEADCDDIDCAEAPECQVAPVEFGDPCESNLECMGLGDTAYCAKESEWGYVDGYCTITCPNGTNCCQQYGMVYHQGICKLPCNAQRSCDDDRMTCHRYTPTIKACLPFCYDCLECDSNSCVLFPSRPYGLCSE